MRRRKVKTGSESPSVEPEAPVDLDSVVKSIKRVDPGISGSQESLKDSVPAIDFGDINGSNDPKINIPEPKSKLRSKIGNESSVFEFSQETPETLDIDSLNVSKMTQTEFNQFTRGSKAAKLRVEYIEKMELEEKGYMEQFLIREKSVSCESLAPPRSGSTNSIDIKPIEENSFLSLTDFCIAETEPMIDESYYVDFDAIYGDNEEAPDIGKMIEILISYKPNIIFERLCDYYSEEYMWDTDHTYREELADALWEEIKLLI